MKLLMVSTFTDISRVKHGPWARCKALRAVENKWTNAFSAQRGASTMIAIHWAVFEK